MHWLHSRRLQWIALLVILGLGFSLRSLHFDSWLHFELDQARDARVVDRALQGGAADLPLLGPKAAGTYLRLPPTYYYFQYISALIFGGTPAGMATFVLLASTAAILFFYLLARRFFAPGWAIGLTLVFAVSPFFVMYGRFAWNPNGVPFFVLAGWYALLRAVDEREELVNRRFLFVAALVSLALSTHFHFLAFLTIPPAVLLFLLWVRPHFSLSVWFLAGVLVLTTFTPVILNEIETGGANAREFLKAVTEKSDTDGNHVLLEKILRNVSEHALHALVITTGYEGGAIPAFIVEGGRLRWNCPDRCDEGKAVGLTALVTLGIAVLMLCQRLFSETDSRKRAFLISLLLWLALPGAVFTLLAYSISPRFFLISGPAFILLLGLLLHELSQRIPRPLAIGSVAGIFVFLVGSNLFFLEQRFSELSRASNEAVDSPPDRILKERIRVTLSQQLRIVDFLQARSRETGFPVYMYSEPQHRRALKYLMEKRGLKNDVLGFSGIYREGVYYLILRAQSDLEDALKKYRESYSVGTITSFGTLVAIELRPLPAAIQAERQDLGLVELPATPSKAPHRYTWREWWSQQGTTTEDDENMDQE